MLHGTPAFMFTEAAARSWTQKDGIPNDTIYPKGNGVVTTILTSVLCQSQ
jgi:hypothetical protein